MQNTKNSKKEDYKLNIAIAICFLVFAVIIIYIFVKSNEGNKPTQASTDMFTDGKNTEVKLDGIGFTMTAGNYICGIDFPPGQYDIQATKGQGNVFATNGLNEIMAKENDDFAIDTYNGSTFALGDILSITSTLKITFGSNAAEIENYTGREKTKNTFKLETGNYLVGTDLPSGTYNIVCTSGSGNIYSDSSTFTLNETMSAENANSMSSYDDLYIKKYNNAILEDGTILSLSGIDVKLTLTQPVDNQEQDN
ncbi:hypothetical protein SAMN02746066_04637 [Anaerosporobacter mobilis DSM 15930]|jgi:hypothetical protein|uniref:Uncharacterized protein n=1 Tax=Anaerosporobacter mobilis DSM 15930 TaxID=1120996 RepID=A0A1M7NNL7_9FIRM|nr:hypothetical protein [Anaerosporobacter mobilis]SHN05537.1 hypothetical protein SAMN02746066_04637 [Anaerosporobacter mobilis DSM 15930]